MYAILEGVNFGDQMGRAYLELPGNTIAFEVQSWRDNSISLYLEESIGGIPPNTYGEVYIERADKEKSNSHNIMFQPRYVFVVSQSEIWHVKSRFSGVSENHTFYSPTLPRWYVPDTTPYTIEVSGDEDDPANIYGGGLGTNSAKHYVIVHAGDERACNLYISVIFRGKAPQGFDIPDEWDNWGPI